MRRMTTLLALLLATTAAADDPFPRPAIPFAPQTYTCVKTSTPPTIDGRLDDAVWQYAAPTAPFADITDGRPVRLETRAMMAWDDHAFYVAARMEEPDLWGTLVERDAVIYHDDDFEVFIDPDGDNHLYYELEVNALNTVWDLLLIKPYRDGAPHAVDAWDITGLRTAVHLDGTLNDPSDRDTGWAVEIAIPWDVLSECAGPMQTPPADGDRWRVNFSRVDWDLAVRDGRYAKLDRPEHNWVWSPQGLIAMHYPERWGVVEFRESGPADRLPELDREEYARAYLMQLYYEQRDHHRREGRYASMSSMLDLETDGTGIDTSWFSTIPRIDADGDLFNASVRVMGRGVLHVDQTGRLWWTDRKE